MSAALDFTALDDRAGFAPVRRVALAPVPSVPLPGFVPVRERDGVVVPLYAPTPSSVAPPLRLTRRGVAVLSGLVAALAAVVVTWGWASAPTTAAPSSAAASVSVRSGDTLWSIAERVAPQRDPRAEVADLQRLNGLAGGTALVPGAVLRTR